MAANEDMNLLLRAGGMKKIKLDRKFSPLVLLLFSFRPIRFLKPYRSPRTKLGAVKMAMKKKLF
jgi:hypothetical protein